MNALAKIFFGAIVILISGIASAQATGSAPAPVLAQFQKASVAPGERIVAAKNTTAAYNWAGYVADSGTFTAVSGTWSVPSVSDAGGNGADAAWVGIGGVDTDDLIQAGTEALPNGRGGSDYSAWVEVLPKDSEIVPLRIHPGDSVTISIREVAPSRWTIDFHNNTTGTAYQKSVVYDSSNSSVEWIEEMPVSPDSPIALDDFGTVRFTNGYAVEDGNTETIGQTGAEPLRMDNSAHQALAIPSELGADGMSFAVMRTESSAKPLTYGRISDTTYEYDSE